MTTFEWLLPFWLVGVVVVLAILSQFLKRSTPLKHYPGLGAQPEGSARFKALGGLRCRAAGGGTITLSMPLARLVVYDSDLRVGPSARLLSVLVPRWTFPYTAIERAEPVKGSFLGDGVRLWVAGVPVVFLTSHQAPLLDAFESFGVPVSRHWVRTAWRSVG